MYIQAFLCGVAAVLIAETIGLMVATACIKKQHDKNAHNLF